VLFLLPPHYILVLATPYSNHYNGCYKLFDLHHTLECKKGGILICCHNKIKDKLVALAVKAFTPSAVHNKPCLHPSCPAQTNNVTEVQPNPINWLTVIPRKQIGATYWSVNSGNVALTASLTFTNVDAKSHCLKPPDKALEWHKKEKELKHLQAAGIHGPILPLHPFCCVHRWNPGPRSNICTSQALCLPCREIIPTLIHSVWLYQSSNEHSHGLCHTLIHERILSPHQPDQHSPPPVGVHSQSRSLPTLFQPLPWIPSCPKTNAHSNYFTPHFRADHLYTPS
jgi:hypothetical protein